jgi:hypothetical protein
VHNPGWFALDRALVREVTDVLEDGELAMVLAWLCMDVDPETHALRDFKVRDWAESWGVGRKWLTVRLQRLHDVSAIDWVKAENQSDGRVEVHWWLERPGHRSNGAGAAVAPRWRRGGSVVAPEGTTDAGETGSTENREQGTGNTRESDPGDGGVSRSGTPAPTPAPESTSRRALQRLPAEVWLDKEEHEDVLFQRVLYLLRRQEAEGVWARPLRQRVARVVGRYAESEEHAQSALDAVVHRWNEHVASEGYHPADDALIRVLADHFGADRMEVFDTSNNRPGIEPYEADGRFRQPEAEEGEW